MDIDNLSSNLLKSVAFEISAPLSFIFNKSLESGVVPRKLKVSRTVPIYKSGSPSDLTNYRPISCLHDRAHYEFIKRYIRGVHRKMSEKTDMIKKLE